MASKQSSTTAAAPAVRTSKPKAVKAAVVIEKVIEKPAPAKTSRVKSARHSKAEAIAPLPVVNAHEAVSKIAYGYWVARGYRGGNQVEDWLRAEREFLSRL